MQKARWLFFVMALLVAAGTASAQVMITEIMQNPSAVYDSDGEWFELYNTTDATIDITNWIIKDNGSNIDTLDSATPIEIPALSYVVLGINSDSLTNGGVHEIYQYASTFSLGNSDDELILQDASGVTIDSVAWDGGPVWPDPNGASMYLMDLTLDNNDGVNWAESASPWPGSAGDFGTPGAPNPTAQTLTLSIDNGTLGHDTPGISVQGFTDATAFDLTVAWDASVYTVTSVTFSDSLTGATATLTDSTANLTWTTAGDPVTLAANTFLATFEGTINGAAGDTTSFTIDPEGTVTDNQGLTFDMSIENGLWMATGTVSIAFIQQNEQDLLGYYFTIGGVMTTPFGAFSSSRTEGYIQDGSGYGVILFDYNTDLTSDLVVGDSVTVIGQVDAYNGKTEFANIDTVIFESSGHPLPTPMDFGSTYDFARADAYEGVWCTLTGVVMDDVPATGSYNLTVDDGSGPATVRIDADAGVDMSTVVKGDTLTLDGVMNYYNGTQITPVTQEGIVAVTGPNMEPMNWGFEDWRSTSDFDLPSYWRLDGYPELMTDSVSTAEYVMEGDYAAMVTLSDNSDQMLAQDLYDITPGYEYRIWGYVLDNDAAGEVYITGDFMDESGTVIESASSDTTADDAAYQELMLDHVAPELAVSVHIAIHFMATDGFVDSFVAYVDGFQGAEIQEATIQDIQTDMTPGDWVTFTGIVTVPSDVLSGSVAKTYIQDDTGYGVMMFSSDPTDALHRGDELTVTGQIDEYFGTTEIVDYEYEVVSTDNPIPRAAQYTTGDLASAQDMEGTYAEITGEMLDDPGTGSYNISVDDGSGPVIVRIYSGANIDMSAYSQGTWVTFRGAIGIYNDAVQLYPAMQEDVFLPTLYSAINLAADLDSTSGAVTLTWEQDTGLTVEELAYDEGDPSGAYTWQGSSMGVHMEPTGPCQVLALKYYLSPSADGPFNAEVYGWSGDAPTTNLLFTQNEDVTTADAGWYEINVAGEGLYTNGDFVVAFGSLNGDIGMGYNSTDNGHAWDFSGGSWSSYNESYFVRAVVGYEDGTVAEIEPVPAPAPAPVIAAEKTSIPVQISTVTPPANELDEFLEYIIYRDDTEIARTSDLTYTDQLTEFGTYSYYVVASYDEGMADPSNTVTVEYRDLAVGEDPSNLPKEFAIKATYPNPFNPTMNVVLAVPKNDNLHVDVYDVLGRKVATLVSGKMNPGFHRVAWRPSNLTSGVYFIRMQTDKGFNQVRKVTYMK